MINLCSLEYVAREAVKRNQGIVVFCRGGKPATRPPLVLNINNQRRSPDFVLGKWIRTINKNSVCSPYADRKMISLGLAPKTKIVQILPKRMRASRHPVSEQDPT